MKFRTSIGHFQGRRGSERVNWRGATVRLDGDNGVCRGDVLNTKLSWDRAACSGSAPFSTVSSEKAWWNNRNAKWVIRNTGKSLVGQQHRCSGGQRFLLLFSPQTQWEMAISTTWTALQITNTVRDRYGLLPPVCYYNIVFKIQSLRLAVLGQCYI